MAIQETPDTQRLLQLLEEEAGRDISAMDVPPEQEEQIRIAHVRQWYLETEKLVRVLANVLPSTMAQPINQLRYAGHHVLKAVSLAEDDAQRQVNLVEAFKHCKRAYYDALDLYIYHMAEAHRDKLAFLPDQALARSLARDLERFLDHVNATRLAALKRIDYYAAIQTDLLAGLRLVAQVNQAMAASGVTAEIVREREELARANVQLKDQVENKLAAGAARFNRWMLAVTILIVLATATGLVFQGAGTQYFLPADPRSIVSSEGVDATASSVADHRPSTPAQPETSKSEAAGQSLPPAVPAEE